MKYLGDERLAFGLLRVVLSQKACEQVAVMYSDKTLADEYELAKRRRAKTLDIGCGFGVSRFIYIGALRREIEIRNEKATSL